MIYSKCYLILNSLNEVKKVCLKEEDAKLFTETMSNHFDDCFHIEEKQLVVGLGHTDNYVELEAKYRISLELNNFIPKQ